MKYLEIDMGFSMVISGNENEESKIQICLNQIQTARTGGMPHPIQMYNSPIRNSRDTFAMRNRHERVFAQQLSHVHDA